MQRIGIIINIRLERPNRHISPTKATGSQSRQAHDELDSTPGAAAVAKAELAQFHTLYEEYEMNLLRQNDAPLSLHLAFSPINIPEFNGEYLDRPRFHDLLIPIFGQSNNTYST